MNTYSKAVAIVQSIVLSKGTIDAAVADKFRWLVQQNIRIMAVSVVARAKSGGMAQCTVMLEDDGANLLTGAMDVGAVAAGTRVEGVLTDTAGVRVAKGSEITADIDAITATNSLSDVELQIDYVAED